MNATSKPPRPPQTSVMTLSTLTTTSLPTTLTAILLGIEGPKEITLRATSTRTLVTNLLLCDETHEGRRLTLWGRSALPVTHFRILDIVTVTRVYSHVSGELRLRHDGTIKRLVPSNDISTNPRETRVAGLLQYRIARFPELSAMAERGRLLAREWTRDSGAVVKQPGNGSDVSDMREFENVRISCIRIRLPRDSRKSQIDAMRALCRRVCSRCMKRLPRDLVKGKEGVVRCPCGSTTNWGFGWLLLGLKGIDMRLGRNVDGVGDSGSSVNDLVFVVVEGEALARLLFGADVRQIVEDTTVANACYSVLETLANDGGVFRVVLRVGNGRPKLLDLQV